VADNHLTMSIPHQLTRAEAKQRIQDGIAQAQQQYGSMLGPIHQQWNGDVLDFGVSAAGQSINGQLFVEDQVVRLDVVLPWILAMLANPVKQMIEQNGRNLLGHK
jgi:putative polyhydroxyalkanoate system protein